MIEGQRPCCSAIRLGLPKRRLLGRKRIDGEIEFSGCVPYVDEERKKDKRTEKRKQEKKQKCLRVLTRRPARATNIPLDQGRLPDDP
jgi:hypothetical protein